jgi:hypothetical protein
MTGYQLCLGTGYQTSPNLFSYLLLNLAPPVPKPNKDTGFRTVLNGRQPR